MEAIQPPGSEERVQIRGAMPIQVGMAVLRASSGLQESLVAAAMVLAVLVATAAGAVRELAAVAAVAAVAAALLPTSFYQIPITVSPVA